MWEKLIIMESFPIYLWKSHWRTNLRLPPVTTGKAGKTCGSNGDTWYMGNNSTQKGNLIQKHRLAENFKEHGELFRACHRPQACLTVPKWHTSLFWSSKSMKKSHSVLLSPLRSFTFLVPLHSLLMANFFLLVLKMFLCLFLMQRSSTEI